MRALIYKGLEGVGFTEVNPDKGTETKLFSILNLLFKKFTEVNPDKGTETLKDNEVYAPDYSLQKLTPIRGRKLPRKLPKTVADTLVYRS